VDEPAHVTEVRHTVVGADTALALGSGDVPVLATPRLLAWLEAATVLALGELPAGQTSVGTQVELAHVGPSQVGAAVVCRATMVGRDARAARFEVEAVGPDGAVVARGTLARALVDRDSFLGRSGGQPR
jgi:predicted thioesterase